MPNCTQRKLRSESVQVKGTGDWSSDSKLACISNGFWKDPYFERFNQSRSIPKRTSLICNGYFVRFRICDYYIRKLISAVSTPVQVVVLGCGMDTLFFRLINDFTREIHRFFEIDFHSVIQRKAEIIARDAELSRISQDKLCLVSADLRLIEQLSSQLTSNGFNPNMPTIFYSECVVNYLLASESEAILLWINRTVPSNIYFAYEQTNPDDSFGKLMMAHFQKNGCPILSMDSLGTIQLQKNQLHRQGYESIYVLNVWDAFVDICKDSPLPIPRIPQNPFDEYEAFVATCLHYSVRIGVSPEMLAALVKLPHLERSIIPAHPSSIKKLSINNIDVFLCTSGISIKGQSSFCSNGIIYLLGGKDQASRSHPMLTQLSILCSSESEHFEVKVKCVVECEPLDRSYASVVLVECGRSEVVIIYGGRKSPYKPRGDVFQYRFDSSLLDSSAIVQESAMPAVSHHPGARWRHAWSPFYTDEISENSACVLMFGGKNSEGIMRDCWIYNVQLNTWQEVLPETGSAFPTARHSHSMCTAKDQQCIFLIGGISANDTTLCEDAFWEYNFVEKKWTRWVIYDRVGRKVGHVAVIHSNWLYIMGGYGNDNDTTAETFITAVNVISKEFIEFELKLDGPNIFLPFDFSAHVIRPERTNTDYLAVIGGGGNCFSFGSYYNSHCLLFKLPLNGLP